MKRIIFSLFLIIICFTSGYSKMYAVIGSGGNATEDDQVFNSEWWTDLYGAYETLLNHGLDHNEIIVLYGEGTDFISKYDRFQNKWQNEITQITDYNNHKATIEQVLDDLSGVITSADTLLFWWVIGHGNAESATDYDFTIENTGEMIIQEEFQEYVDRIENYSFRIFIWCTCQCEPIKHVLANDKTVIMTCTQYDESHQPTFYDNPPFQANLTVTAVFPYFIRGFFNSHSMAGQPFDADDDDNDRINVPELRSHIQEEYGKIDWLLTSTGVEPGPLDNTVVISDNGNNAENTYPVSNEWTRCLEFKYLGLEEMRISQAGYSQIEGTEGSGSLSGLKFTKSATGVSITNDGNLRRSNSEIYQHTWLDTPSNLTGGLIFKNPGNMVVGYFNNSGTIRLRGWVAEEYPRFQ